VGGNAKIGERVLCINSRLVSFRSLSKKGKYSCTSFIFNKKGIFPEKLERIFLLIIKPMRPTNYSLLTTYYLKLTTYNLLLLFKPYFCRR
jgi:hypothetical protein